jgi:hypothetical protein
MFKETQLDLYKVGNKIRCYIREWTDFESGERKWNVCTGKPSDYTAICWLYSSYEKAQATAMEYFTNVTLGQTPKIQIKRFHYAG